MDQSGFMLQPTRRRTWALSGHTPIHKVWDRHDRLSVQAAVTLPPRRQLGVLGMSIILTGRMWYPLSVICCV